MKQYIYNNVYLRALLLWLIVAVAPTKASAQCDEDFVQLRGYTYFDLNYVPSTHTKVMLQFSAQSVSTADIFGVLDGTNSWRLRANYSTLQFGRDNSSFLAGCNDYKAGDMYCVTMSMSEFILDSKFDAAIHLFSKTYSEPQDLTITKSLWLGTCNGGTLNSPNMKVYQCVIFEGGKKVRHYVPARKEGTPYLYELMEGKYYDVKTLSGYSSTNAPTISAVPPRCSHKAAFPNGDMKKMHCPVCSKDLDFEEYNVKSNLLQVTDPCISLSDDRGGYQSITVSSGGKMEGVFVLTKSAHELIYNQTEGSTDAGGVEINIAPINHVDTLMVFARGQLTQMVGTRQDSIPAWTKTEVPYLPMYSISKTRAYVKGNLDEQGLRHPSNVVEFAIDNVQVEKTTDGKLTLYPLHLQEMQPDDIFTLTRSETPGFELVTPLNGVGMEKPDYIETIKNRNGTESYRAWYSYEDKSIHGQKGVSQKDTVVCAIDPRLLEEGVLSPMQRAILKDFYSYPERKVYYRVRRAVGEMLWDNMGDYERFDSLLLTNMLPAVDSIKVVQDNNWHKTKRVSVNVKLQNPYPWEYNRMIDEKELRDVCQVKGIEIARRYMWDEQATVLVKREGYDANGRLIPEATRTYNVSSKDINWDPKEGYYTLSVKDVQNLPYLRYYYTAVVDPSSTNYPIADETPRRTTDAEAAMSVSEDAQLASDLKVSKGTDRGCVVLEWKNENADLDLLRIERRLYDANNDEEGNWEVLSTDRSISYFKDETCHVGHVYEYRLTSGMKISYLGDMLMTSSLNDHGWMDHMGKLAGRVMMNDGTSMANVKLRITREEPVFIEEVRDRYGNIVMEGVNEGVTAEVRPQYAAANDTVNVIPSTFRFEREITTDENGHWVLDSVYVTDKGLRYDVEVFGYEGEFQYKGITQNASVSLTSSQYENTAVDFKYISTTKVTGHVYYENSTVAVPGAHFFLDGIALRDSKGDLIVTQPDGRFSLTVSNKRKIDKLEVRKPGHVFVNDGIIRENTVVSKQTDGLMIYDKTKVRVAGRIVGGDVQGKKPMGVGMSKNNLGDNIKLELQLEGDITASLVYFITDPDRTTVEQTIEHCVDTVKAAGTYVKGQAVVGKTHMKMDRKRIYVDVDNETGEFMIDLFPAKYKVTKMIADGYATLYTAGEGVLTIDYSDIEPVAGGKEVLYDTEDKTYQLRTHYDVAFNRIYHAPLSVTYQQKNNGRAINFYGEKTYSASNILGNEYSVDLVCEHDNSYTFGHPVFKKGKTYEFEVSAHEDYHYNNLTSGHIDIVPVAGDSLIVNNGIGGNNDVKHLRMDGAGKATVYLTADNTIFSEVGERALRTTHFTVINNGLYSESEPLKAYVLGSKVLGTNIMTLGDEIKLIDVLRDPPGSKSYAYLDRGTTYEWNYDSSKSELQSHDISGKFGVGVVNGFGIGVSITSDYSLYAQTSLNWSINRKNTRTRQNYTMTSKTLISTGSDDKTIGAGGDVYIGTTTNYGLSTDIAMVAIDSATYNRMKEGINSDAIKVVAFDKKSGSALVVGDYYNVVPYRMEPFTYSQNHIVNNIIPTLEKYAESLITTGDSLAVLGGDSEVPRYWRSPKTGYIYFKAPSNSASTDILGEALKSIKRWKQIIKANEDVKLAAMNVEAENTYTLAGSKIEHYEEASSYVNTNVWEPGYSMSWSVGAGGGVKPRAPKADEQANNQEQQEGEGHEEDEHGGIERPENGENDQIGPVEHNQQIIVNHGDDNNNAPQQVRRRASAFKGLGVLVELSYNYSPKSSGTSDNYYIKTSRAGYGYVLETNSDSYLDIAVHEVAPDTMVSNFISDKAIESLQTDMKQGVPSKDQYSTAHNYVFEVRGGAQRNPWVAPDSTLYQPENVPLGVQTLKIDNPKIYVDAPVANNVARSENAVFSIRLTNEAEATFKDPSRMAPSVFYLRLADESNPLGAKVYMDGQPISDGRSFTIPFGQSITKTLEVARGKSGYDYEDLCLVLSDACGSLSDKAKISVHYMPESSPLRITMPTDKWVMNTYSSVDKDGLYYMPIEIGDFNLNYDNFHHIEMQYKKHNDGEDKWVTMCSYFANDSLMRNWTGTKEKILYGSKIDNIRFYGGTNIEEQEYDLRAVSYCSFGNGYVTTASPVVQGMKDTRRPEIFGVPSPANGILTFDDVIQFPYTERIAYNHLNATSNFTVKGYTNDTDNLYNHSLHFNAADKPQVYTTQDRVLSDRNFTIDMMAKTTSNGFNLIFGHGGGNGTQERQMRLYLLGPQFFNSFIPGHDKWHLMYVTDETLVLSEGLEGIDADQILTRVGVTQEIIEGTSRSHIRFIGGQNLYDIDSELTRSFIYEKEKLEDYNLDGVPTYKGVGPCYVGYVPPRTGMTNADITELRLWSTALNSDEVKRTYNKRLSGYNRHLIAYWPMNEGHGDIAEDVVGGATMVIKGATWTKPTGYSLKADHREVALRADELAAITGEDYTLSLWFRTTADENEEPEVGILRSGDDRMDVGKGKSFLGYKGNKMVFESHGKDIVLGNRESYSNGNWHLFCLSKNNALGVYSIYLDGKLASQGSSDAIDRLSDARITLGDTAVVSHFDNISLWKKALSTSYIKENANVTLRGTESDLMVYIPFEKDTIAADNTPIQVFSPVNQRMVKQILDLGQNQFVETGKMVAVGTQLIPDDEQGAYGEQAGYDVISDDEVVAPNHPMPELSNLDFSWSSTGTALQININRSDKDINKQYIHVTVRDIEDEHGNTTLAPHMWTYFIDKNVLKWDKKTINLTVPYGQPLATPVVWRNLSGKQTPYTISNNVSWLSFSTATSPYYEERELMGVADAEEENEVILNISDGLSPGQYSEIIYLTDDNELYEPLTINLTVEPNDPGWEVDKSKYEYSMNLRAQVVLQQNTSSSFGANNSPIIDNDTRDVVAAFVGMECVGKANITVKDGQAYVYLTIYGNADMQKANQPITLRLWRAVSGVVNELARYEALEGGEPLELCFKNRDTFGMPPGDANVLRTTTFVQQELNLKPGWNWVSFNVTPEPKDESTWIINTSKGFVEGDIFKHYDFNSYSDVEQKWKGSLQKVDRKFVYQIYAQKGAYLTVRGTEFSVDSTYVEISKNRWGDMPYYLNVVQPINVALSDCKIGDKASIGDIVKSYDAFAVASENGWEGSLQYLRPGEGYYYYHNGKSTSFHYNSVNNNATQTTTNKVRRKERPRTSDSSMPIIAVTDDELGLLPGDVLLAYCNGELISEAEATEVGKHGELRYFLSVNAENGNEISFAIRRAGEVIPAATRLVYNTDKVAGSLDLPTVISRTEADVISTENSGIYSVAGYKVERVPSGVYITNNKKYLKK